MHRTPAVVEKPDLARRRALLATLGTAGLAGVPPGAALTAFTALTAATAAGCTRQAAVPDLAYTLLDGSRGSTAALRGQVVLVNFWATQCAPCVAGMPGLVALHQGLRQRGLQTLAVAMAYDAPAAVAQFAEAHRLPFGLVIDNTGAIARGFGDVSATPTTVVLDRQGRVALRSVGKPADDALRTLLERLLASPAGTSA